MAAALPDTLGFVTAAVCTCFLPETTCQCLISCCFIDDSASIHPRRWEKARDSQQLMLVPVFEADMASCCGCCILSRGAGLYLASVKYSMAHCSAKDEVKKKKQRKQKTKHSVETSEQEVKENFKLKFQWRSITISRQV